MTSTAMTSTVPFRDTPPGLLAVTTDGWIGERVAGLAAAAGIPLEHRRDLPAGWSRQPDLPLVLVDHEADLVGERRPGVILICAGEPEPPVWRRAVETGVEQVVVLPEGEPWLLDRMLDAAVPAPSAAVLGVIGGRGGAGASTLAVGLASVATRSGLRTVLLDTDPLGGGLDLLVGAEREGGLRWDDLLGARGRLQPALLSSMLPTVDDLSVLSWGRRAGGFGAGQVHPDAVSAVLQSATREFDLVVVDLSRRFAQEDLPALRACRTVIVVVPSEVRATVAATEVLVRLDPLVADQRLVVRGPAPAGLPAEAVAEALGLPLVGQLRSEAAVAAALDRGEPLPARPRGALTVLSRRLLANVLAA
jgi:secretion/DNA translocation related CpaE-like protein